MYTGTANKLYITSVTKDDDFCRDMVNKWIPDFNNSPTTPFWGVGDGVRQWDSQCTVLTRYRSTPSKSCPTMLLFGGTTGVKGAEGPHQLTRNLNVTWSGRQFVSIVRCMHALSPTPRHATPRRTSWSRSLTVPPHWFSICTLRPQPSSNYAYHTLITDLRRQNKNIVLIGPRKHSQRWRPQK